MKMRFVVIWLLIGVACNQEIGTNTVEPNKSVKPSGETPLPPGYYSNNLANTIDYDGFTAIFPVGFARAEEAYAVPVVEESSAEYATFVSFSILDLESAVIPEVTSFTVCLAENFSGHKIEGGTATALSVFNGPENQFCTSVPGGGGEFKLGLSPSSETPSGSMPAFALVYASAPTTLTPVLGIPIDKSAMDQVCADQRPSSVPTDANCGAIIATAQETCFNDILDDMGLGPYANLLTVGLGDDVKLASLQNPYEMSVDKVMDYKDEFPELVKFAVGAATLSGCPAENPCVDSGNLNHNLDYLTDGPDVGLLTTSSMIRIRCDSPATSLLCICTK